MTDAQITLQFLHGVIVEDVIDHAHPLVHVEILRILVLAGHNAGRLLATMLKGDQTEADDLSDIDLRVRVNVVGYELD